MPPRPPAGAGEGARGGRAAPDAGSRAEPARSAGEGAGAEFTVRLPLSADAAARKTS